MSRDFPSPHPRWLGPDRRHNALPPASLHALAVQILITADHAVEMPQFHRQNPAGDAPAPPAGSPVFSPETGSMLQWLRAIEVPFDCSRSISFSARSCGVRLEFRQQLLFRADHILNGGARRTVQRTPRTAVKVLSRWICMSRMAGSISFPPHRSAAASHPDAAYSRAAQLFSVFDFNGLQRGTGVHHH